MASTRRKSAAIAIAIVGVAGLSLAAAAQLTVSPSMLGAGSTLLDATCDSAVTADFTTEYNTTTGVYDVTEVEISGIDATACSGQTILVTVTDDSDADKVLLSDGTGTLAGTVTIPLTTDAPAAHNFNVAVVIH